MAFWNKPAAQPGRDVQHAWIIDGGEVRTLTLTDEGIRDFFGVSASRIPTGDTAALTYPASARCIALISMMCGQTPFHVYRRGADNSRARERDHVADRLLNGFVNPWLPSDEFLRDMTRRALLQGQAFGRIVRVRGEAREIHPVTARVEPDRTTGEPSYVVSRANGGEERLRYTDVLHLISPTGGAPAKDAARAIELGLRLEAAANGLLKNGGRPSALLLASSKMDSDTPKKIREAWADLNNDLHGAPAVLGGGLTYVPLTTTSVDAEHNANRATQVNEVARHFGVPPTLLAELADASLNNSESLAKQFLVFGLQPWLSAWTGAISRALVPAKDRGELYVEAFTANLASADTKALAEALRLAIGGPWLTPNEGRSGRNLPSLDGGDRLNPVQGAAPTTPSA